MPAAAKRVTFVVLLIQKFVEVVCLLAGYGHIHSSVFVVVTVWAGTMNLASSSVKFYITHFMFHTVIRSLSFYCTLKYYTEVAEINEKTRNNSGGETRGALMTETTECWLLL